MKYPFSPDAKYLLQSNKPVDLSYLSLVYWFAVNVLNVQTVQDCRFKNGIVLMLRRRMVRLCVDGEAGGKLPRAGRQHSLSVSLMPLSLTLALLLLFTVFRCSSYLKCRFSTGDVKSSITASNSHRTSLRSSSFANFAAKMSRYAV